MGFSIDFKSAANTVADIAANKNSKQTIVVGADVFVEPKTNRVNFSPEFVAKYGVKSAIAFVAKDSETGASFPAIQLNPAVEPPKFTDNGFTNSDKGGNSNSAICSLLTNEKQEIHTYVVIQKIKTVRDGKEVETSAHVINKGDEPTIDEAKTYTLPMACHCKLVELESWAVYTEQDELDGLGEEGQTYNQAAGYFSLSFVATAKSAAPRVYAVNN